MMEEITEDKKTRRKRGQGECYFKVLSNGKVYGRKMVGYKENGKPKIVVATKATKKECKKELERKEKEYQKEKELIYSNEGIKKERFSDFFWKWYRTFKEITYEETTRLTRETALINLFEHFEAFPIRDYKMEELNTDIFQIYFNTLAKYYALATIKPIEYLMKQCLEYAVGRGLYYQNPMKVIKLKEASISADHKRKKLNVLNDEEILKLKEEAAKKRTGKGGTQVLKYRNSYAIILLLFTGMRLGEALALKWEDVDFEREILHINKSLGQGKEEKQAQNFYEEKRSQVSSKWIEKSPKTEAGIRTIALEPEALEALIKIREQYKEEGLKETQRILVTHTGKTISKQQLQVLLVRMCQNAGIQKRVNLHMLRHTYCSMLIRRGVRIEVISRILGHSKTSTTTDIYTHILKEQLIDRNELRIFDSELQKYWMEELKVIRSLQHSEKRDIIDTIIRLSKDERELLGKKLIENG